MAVLLGSFWFTSRTHQRYPDLHFFGDYRLPAYWTLRYDSSHRVTSLSSHGIPTPRVPTPLVAVFVYAWVLFVFSPGPENLLSQGARLPNPNVSAVVTVGSRRR